MKSKEQYFKELMLDPEWKEWYDSRPEVIQQLAQEYPYTIYRIKEGAPYALTVPGSLVYLQAYSEGGLIRVALFKKDFLPATIKNIKSLQQQHGTHVDEGSGISAHVEPQYLEPCEGGDTSVYDN